MTKETQNMLMVIACNSPIIIFIVFIIYKGYKNRLK